jgi:hypothetical protein
MKARRIDYRAGDMLADVGGELTPVEFGVYWMICTLIYQRLDWVEDDADWIAGKFKRPGTDPRTIRAAIERLVAMEKVTRSGGKLMVKRCRVEIEKAESRIQKAHENGTKGGRPRKEQPPQSNEISGQENRTGFNDEKLSTSNQQTATSRQQPAQQQEDAVPRIAGAHERYGEVAARVLEITGGKAVGTNRVDAWLKAGAEPEQDIYPTLKRKLPEWRSGSLVFFDGAIADAIKTRTAPLPEGNARAPSKVNGNGSYEPRPLDAEENQWRARLKTYKPGKHWPEVWGPPPGEPGCMAPAAMLREFNLC